MLRALRRAIRSLSPGAAPRPGARRAAFQRALQGFARLLTGKKKIYFQEPRQYFFPGLPQIQFYDRDGFPWLDKVEAATADIRAELIEVLKQESAFRPYVEGNPRLPQTDPQGMLNNRSGARSICGRTARSCRRTRRAAPRP